MSYTEDEYFDLDEAAPKGVRLEYLDGTIYLNGHVFEPSMGWDAARGLAGASKEHGQIKHNVEVAIGNQLRDRDCDIFSSDMRSEVAMATKSGYVYPDVVMSCEAEYKGATLKNPQFLIEILSPRTAKYDLTRKKEAYASRESAREFWFIYQNEVRVVQHIRTEEGWTTVYYTDIDQIVRSDAFDLEIPMREVYRRVF